MGPLLCSCVEVREAIELSFGVVSGVGSAIDLGDGGPRGLGEWVDVGFFAPLSQWFQWPNFQEKCI